MRTGDVPADHTLGSLLEARAEESPDRRFLRMADTDLTFGEFNRECNRVADGLLGIGIGGGDVVAVVLPNCPEFLLTWFALAKIGAAEAAINTAFRGPGLARVLTTLRCRAMVVDEAHLERLDEVAGAGPRHDCLRELETLVVRGDAADAARRFPHCRVIAFEELCSARTSNPGLPVKSSELAMLLFTSGTTGPSKGCMLSHRYGVRQGALLCQHMRLERDDVLYSPFPLFHADAATLTVVPALVLGATAAIGERFSTTRFWDEVRAFDATVFDFMGATLTMLWKQPTDRRDRDNPVRLAWGVPMPPWASDFEERFALKLVEVYGLTDAGVVAFYPYDDARKPGACGRAVHPYEVKIFDEDDHELPIGEVGEIVVRSLEPWVTMNGYYGMPEETLAAFRNLWLHTGDRGCLDAEGLLYFAGRQTDSIRRRGENISAFEVEEVVVAHPDVIEAAAIGVPSEFTEEELKVCVVPRTGTAVAPADIVSFCQGRLADFMIPRYIEVLAELPKTSTQKVEKYRLREGGLGPGTWDRQADA